MSASEKLKQWFEERFGLKSVDSILRPIPNFSFRPDYWLGALLALGFVLQGITGFLLLLYYVPTPSQAWASTHYIMTSVPYGSLLLTFHLYDAYAIILIAFLHMFRNFFVGSYKRPRESMWFYGVILGLITLGFGFTGYLLPWTVISKSATDVGIGMLNYFPSWLTGPLKSLLVGNGTDASELTRFFAMHVILLPLLLALFLSLKIFTYEAHGMAPPLGKSKDQGQTSWYPGGLLYLTMIGLFYIGGLLIISSMFPATLPPAYSVQAAMAITPEPDWYFLWIYQILKLSIFGGPNVIYALTLISLLFVVLFFVPVIDLKGGRAPHERPVIFTLGMIVATSVIFLTIWAYLTPGQTVPFYQAVLYIGGIAVVEGIAAYLGLKRRSNGSGKVAGVHPSIAMLTLVASIIGASASLLMLEKGYLISALLLIGFIYSSIVSISKIEAKRE